jgi:hypothetical protein
MNCQQFDQIVVELARGRGVEGRTPQGAVDHARSCPRCAARLSDQRKLAAALRAVNSAASNEQAPASVEHSLLSAFRARFDASCPATAVETTSPRRGGAVAWPVWAVAAAAVMLLLGIVAIWRLEPTSPARSSDRASSPRVSNKKPAEVATVGNDETQPAAAVVRHLVSRPRRTAKYGTPSKPHATSEQVPATEVTTRFYPLPYGSGLGLDEGWALVRVQVPRASLASLGVPISAGSESNEMLTADVVVGQDGLARGIRFVQ